MVKMFKLVEKLANGYRCILFMNERHVARFYCGSIDMNDAH